MQAQVSTYRPRRIAAWLLGLMLLVTSGIASADPPARVARLGYLSGTVSFNAAGDDEWVQAALNRPLTTGDRLWADQGGRAEVQAGSAVVRMSAGTDLSLLNLDDRTAQMQLTQGVLNVRLRRSAPDQVYEIDTPNLALTMREPAVFRVEVDPDGNATSVFVRSGQVEVYGEGASYVLDAQHPYRFTGTGLREYEPMQLPPPDDFDRWASERDRIYDRAASTRYVSPEVVGYEDLDAYGTWQSDPSYGNVWVPTRVSADWAPYRDGHWAWVEPWGWTWIDDAPWGFAVTHYGRWAHVRQRWCWVPGPVQVRPYYAPALVAFVGGENFSLSISTGTVGGVAWFPLAPREVYRPAYAVSRRYYENVNVSNTVINTTVINNTYNTTNVTNVVYANRQVPGAVVAVPQTAFVQSQPVAKAAVRVPQERLVSRPVAVAPSVAPEKGARGRAMQANNKPPATAIERTVVAREAPPAAQPKFEPSKQAAAGRAEEPRKETRPAAQGPKPNVKVIAKQEEGRPTAAPPPTAAAKPGGNAEEQARARDEGKGQTRGPDEGKDQARGRDEGKGQARGPDEGKEQARGRDEGKEPARGREENKGPPPRAVANAPAAPSPAQRAPTPPDSERQVPATPTPAPEQRAKPGQPEAPRPPVPRNAPEPAKPPAVVAPQPEQRARPAVPRPPETRTAPDERDRSSQRERDPRERAQPAPRSPATSPPAQAKVPDSPPAPRPLPPPAEPRRPEPRDRAEPPAPRPAAPPSPQAKVNPPAQEAPRPRAEPPRPREDVARPPAPQPAPPPAARAEPRPPAGVTPPQAHPAPQPRPNERKKNEEPDRGEKN